MTPSTLTSKDAGNGGFAFGDPRLQALIDNAQTGMVLIRPVWEIAGSGHPSRRISDFEFVLINRIQADYIGQEPAALVGKRCRDWFPDYYTNGLFARYCEVYEQGGTQRFEFHYAADGIDAWIDVQATRFEDGVLITFSDHTLLKQTQLVQQKQTAFLNQLLAVSPGGVIAYEAVRAPAGDGATGAIVDFRPVFHNPAYIHLVQEPEERIRTLRFRERFPASVHPGLFEFYVALTEGEPSFRREHYYPHIQRWVDVSGCKLNDGFMVVLHDITEQKGAAAQLKAQNQLIEKVLDGSGNAIFVAEAIRNTEGAITDFLFVQTNKAARTLMLNTIGFDGTGKTFTATSPFGKSSPESLYAEYARVVETGESLELEKHFERFSIWQKVTLEKMGDGFVATFVDITDVRKAEQQARLQAEQLQGVVDASLNGLILLEAVRDTEGEVTDFKYLLANRPASRINGVPLDEMIGNTLLTLFPTSRTSGSFPQNVHALKTGEPVRKQLRLICDRMQGWYDFATNRINENLLVVSFTDITGLKLLEERQTKLLEDLKRSNEQLQQFAYVASHDLQEPLRKIQSFGDILATQYVHNETEADLIRRMQSAAGRMAVLIRDLLTYSRLSTHQEPFGSIALGELFEEVLDDLEVAIQESRTEVSISALPDVMGNRLQLRQLFQNLLSNAIKFRKSNEPSRVWVTCQEVAGPDLSPVLDTSRTYYEISVADKGIGFDPSQSEQIFQVFQRLHGRNQYEGTGIGLAICSKVAQNHSGTITVTSQPGEGSTFRVYLPADTPESA